LLWLQKRPKILFQSQFIPFLLKKRIEKSDYYNAIHIFAEIGDIRFVVYGRKKRIVNPFDNLFIRNGLHQKRQKFSKLIIHGFIFLQLLSHLFCLSGFFLDFLDGNFRDFFSTGSSNFATFYGSKHFFSHFFKRKG
jgi:hypothetical protein